jgi:hypothetical protein
LRRTIVFGSSVSGQEGSATNDAEVRLFYNTVVAIPA